MDSNERILNSEMAVDILGAVASRKEGNYSTNIAEDLDKSQPSISRMLTNLHDIGFIKKGKREKAQYYKLNYQGIAEYWCKELESKLEEENSDKKIKRFKKEKDKIKEFTKTFFQNVLTKYKFSDNLTTSEFLFYIYMYAIGYNIKKDNEFLEKNSFLKPANYALARKLEERGYCPEICKAMEETINQVKLEGTEEE